MQSGDFIVMLAILIYFIAVLIIGFSYAKRSNSSSSEYFLGGRKVGPWFTALSAEASDMSGYLLMGLPGLAYFTGAADVGWTAIGLALGTYLNWLLVAKRLRRYSEVAGDAITLPGFYSNRFHDDRNVIGTIAAVIILVFFCVYTGSCFVTCGKLFHSLFGVDYSLMMVFGAIIVFLYTMVGGYLSVVATDFLQGTLMFFALAVVVIGSITMAGGLDNTVAFLSDIPGYLTMVQTAVPVLDANGTQVVENGMPLFDSVPKEYGLLAIISTMSWGLGYFGMPQVLVRFMGIRSDTEVKQSRRIAIVWVIVSMFSAVMIGIIGRYLIPTELLTQSTAESIFIV
ncbi:MAG: sodium/proline symporter, partial [Coriobacteriales bacterium]